MVRALHRDPRGFVETAPRSILVVEVLSPRTRKHDRVTKRNVYIDDAGIPAYGIVDGDAGTLVSCARGRPDPVLTDRVTWHPSGAAGPTGWRSRSPCATAGFPLLWRVAAAESR
ncbi:MAG: Uma2 family endonuclease [Cytophagaceae bacterium]|nr:Uma2 family endonuclease [Gemmatimonadaceae bacterium]